MVDKQFVIDIAPELATQADSRFDRFIPIATSQTPQDVWGDQTDFAIALLTAHYMSATANGGRGQVVSEKVGDLQRNYEGMGGDNLLLSTAYGQQYVELRNSLVITPRLAGPCPQ